MRQMIDSAGRTMPDHIAVEVNEISSQAVLSATANAPADNWGPAYGPLLAEVLAYLDRSHASPAGPPFARFETRGDHVTLEAGVPIAVDLPGDGRVSRTFLPGGLAAMTAHVGPYNLLGSVHQEIREWIKHHGHQAAGPFWDVYLTDPASEPDESRWRTQVVYMLEA